MDTARREIDRPDWRPRLVVTADGVTHLVDPDGLLRFGRAADNEVVIGSARRGDVEDTLVSRFAGEVRNLFPEIAVRNTGTYVPLDLHSHDDPGRARRVECGDELRLAAAPVSITLPGRVRRYVLTLDPEWSVHGRSMPPRGTNASPIAPPTEGPLDLTEERRLDLAALSAPLLVSGARRSTRAASYADAAARRGIARKTLEKRVEYLVAVVRAHGTVPGLEPGADVKQALCEFAVRTGTVTPADLARLDVAMVVAQTSGGR